VAQGLLLRSDAGELSQELVVGLLGLQVRR
jgi:hypothetical protein